MKLTIRIVGMFLLSVLLLFQCAENELIAPQETAAISTQALATADELSSLYQTGSTYYVSTTGNDSGDGSAGNPWKTLKNAVTKVPAGQGHTIKLSAGTFVENGLIEVPLGVNIEGAGKDQTILKAASTFYYNPTSPEYATEKFLLSLNGFNYTTANQILKKFTIDGDGKKLHGGIYVHYRNKVAIDEVKVQNTNFTGIWLWDVKDVQFTNSNLLNCSWGSAGWCSGALNLGHLERVEIANLNIDESTGYGIKAIGPGGYNNLLQVKIHDSRISVHPFGLWNGGSAPNIAIELWGVSMVGCEIYNTYVDNTISLVNSNAPASTGVQTIRVHHNVLDMETRAQGAGYGVELTINDAEVDHNFFLKGTYGIANWDNPVKNWNIHHNVFYAMQGTYPGEAVRSQWSGLHNVKFYNNTIEFAGTKTMNVIGVYGGTSENIDVKNNLVINSNSSYSYYQNQFLHRENGAVVNTLTVKNNLFNNIDLNVGGLVGGVLGILDPLLSNITVNPQIAKSGVRPEPYYILSAGSPMIDAGANVGMTYQGAAPDIGAYESGTPTAPTGSLPQVSITSPASNTSFTSGSSITINANASDSDGSVSKVEFFNGTVKLGEDVASPYSFVWSNVPTGSYALTTKATDNSGATSTSGALNITVTAGGANSAPTVTLTSPTNNSSFTAGTSVTITASASDSDGSVAKVEFYKDGTKIGEDTSAPYRFSWLSIAEGSYSLTAKAIDNKGAVKTSSPVPITITVAGKNKLPSVGLVSPLNNSSFSSGSSIIINATATDSDGSVTKVEFYSGSSKIGEDLSAPYSFVLAAPASGGASLSARATDNQGAIGISAPVSFSVNTQSQSFIELNLDASQATLSGAMALSNDAQAGSYFSVPSGNGQNFFIPPSASASYSFQVSKTDSYVMWVRVKTPTANNQSYHLYDGKGNWTTWSAGMNTQWTWVKVKDAYTGAVVNFSFSQGTNNIQFGWLDDNVQVDKLLITNNLAFTPI